jgi:hypothetical protein
MAEVFSATYTHNQHRDWWLMEALLGKRKVLYKTVGFGRATRPSAARSCLFRLIHAQNRALRHFYNDESKNKPAHEAYADQQLNYCNSPESIKWEWQLQYSHDM